MRGRNYLTDALGSSVALTDGSGTIQTEYTYQAFGATSVSGASTLSALAFTGRENDGTGLYYYRARYYHPTAQRFVAEDPLSFAAGDPNLYGYVFNAPADSTDPTGEILPWVAACALGAAGSAAGDYMAGRKFSWKSAGAGCGMGLLGMGAAKAAGAAARAMGGWGGRSGPLFRGGARPKPGPVGHAAEGRPPLKPLHSPESMSKASKDYWSKQSTDDIVDSLKPGAKQPLQVKPDGTIMDGNHRVQVLQERGYPTNTLPRVPYPGGGQ